MCSPKLGSGSETSSETSLFAGRRGASLRVQLAEYARGGFIRSWLRPPCERPKRLR